MLASVGDFALSSLADEGWLRVNYARAPVLASRRRRRVCPLGHRAAFLARANTFTTAPGNDIVGVRKPFTHPQSLITASRTTTQDSRNTTNRHTTYELQRGSAEVHSDWP